MRYYLYFIRDGKHDFYGSGDMPYIMELLNDYLNIHKIYGEEAISFKVSSKAPLTGGNMPFKKVNCSEELKKIREEDKEIDMYVKKFEEEYKEKVGNKNEN